MPAPGARAPGRATHQHALVLVHKAAVGADSPERICGGRGAAGGSRSGRGALGEVGVGLFDGAEGGVSAGVGIARRSEEIGEAAEGALDVGGVGVGLQLEDREGIGAAGGDEALGGEVDIGDGEELVGAGEERVRVHRALREALATDQVARGEEPASDLQPPGRLPAAAAGGEIHVVWVWVDEVGKSASACWGHSCQIVA